MSCFGGPTDIDIARYLVIMFPIIPQSSGVNRFHCSLPVQAQVTRFGSADLDNLYLNLNLARGNIGLLYQRYGVVDIRCCPGKDQQIGGIVGANLNRMGTVGRPLAENLHAAGRFRAEKLKNLMRGQILRFECDHLVVR